MWHILWTILRCGGCLDIVSMKGCWYPHTLAHRSIVRFSWWRNHSDGIYSFPLSMVIFQWFGVFCFADPMLCLFVDCANLISIQRHYVTSTRNSWCFGIVEDKRFEPCVLTMKVWIRLDLLNGKSTYVQFPFKHRNSLHVTSFEFITFSLSLPFSKVIEEHTQTLLDQLT